MQIFGDKNYYENRRIQCTPPNALPIRPPVTFPPHLPGIVHDESIFHVLFLVFYADHHSQWPDMRVGLELPMFTITTLHVRAHVITCYGFVLRHRWKWAR